MFRKIRPALETWLSDLHSLVGPLPCRVYDALPGELAQLQASLLLIADEPQGGVALFRLSEAEADASTACLARVRAVAESLAPGLIRALTRVELQDGARLVVFLSPMPSLERWAGAADLRPVLGTSLADLEELLVDHAPQDVGAEALSAVPELWDEPVRALIALGALFPWRGELLATVAGLLTYGAFDRQVLPGQRIVERVVGQDLPRLGDIGEMIEGPVEALVQRAGLPKRIAAAILVNALALRRWSGRDEPVFVEATEAGATVRCPDTRLADWQAREGRRPNLHLDALLLRLEIGAGPPMDLRTIQQELRCAGLPALEVEERADEVVFTLRLSDRPVAQDQVTDRPVQTRPPAVVPARPVAAPGQIAPALRSVLKLDPPAEPSCFASATRATVYRDDARPPRPSSGPGARPAPTRSRPGAHLSAEARARQVLGVLSASPEPLTRHQLVRTLAWSRSTARAVLAALVSDGRVQLEAAAPRSPHQRYRAASGG